MKNLHVTIVCAGCGVRITGKMNRKGELRAARYPKPDAPEVPGYCMSCVPHARITGVVFSFDVAGVKS